jgi:hypothetical protein
MASPTREDAVHCLLGHWRPKPPWKLVRKTRKCGETFNYRGNWVSGTVSFQRPLKKAALHFQLFGFSLVNMKMSEDPMLRH